MASLPVQTWLPRRLATVVASRRFKVGLLAVIGCLILAEQVAFFLTNTSTQTRGHAPPALSMHGALRQRLDGLLRDALPPSDRGVRRYRVDAVRPDPGSHHLKVVTVTWSINNDISAGTVGNGAQIDVYNILRAVYTAHLPIERVWLYGTYPMRSRHGVYRETPVMRLAMSRRTADYIAREVGWSNVDATLVWPLVHAYYVSPDFAPSPSE